MATEETVQKETFILWIDHGNKPQAAKYEYIVVPGIDASSIDKYSSKKQITVLSNTADLQAVRHNALHITSIVFYKPGSITIDKGMSLVAQNPCMVMIKTNGNKIEKILVSDPTQKLKSMQLNTTAHFESLGKNWRSVWDKQKNVSVVHVDLPMEGYAGQSVVIE